VCDEGEQDDEYSPDSRRMGVGRRMVGMGDQGKRLTAKSLRQMQRGLSGNISSAGVSGGDISASLASFSNGNDELENDDVDDDDDDDFSVIDMDFWVIPNGWEEYFDTDSQNVYYLNTITQVSLTSHTHMFAHEFSL
jgi:hypothetical protein